MDQRQEESTWKQVEEHGLWSERQQGSNPGSQTPGFDSLKVTSILSKAQIPPLYGGGWEDLTRRVGRYKRSFVQSVPQRTCHNK